MKPFKFIGERLTGGGWTPFADQVEQLEAEESARRLSRECEAEEIQRLGVFDKDQYDADILRSRLGGVPLAHLRALPYIEGNRFVDGTVERIPNPEQNP